MDLQARLHNFAASRCVPYLVQEPRFAPYIDRLSFVLVGSVATGLCDDRSDVDIAVVCDDHIFGLVSQGTEWTKGRPTEVILEGIQLHYYAVSLSEIASRIYDLDDLSIYIYFTGIPLVDPEGQFARMIGLVDKVALRQRRLKHAQDYLTRRSRVLDDDLSSIDPLALASLFIELIRLIVKTIALVDDVPFDPRKRMLATGLSGSLGHQMRPLIMRLMADLGELGSVSDGRVLSFTQHFLGAVAALPTAIEGENANG